MEHRKYPLPIISLAIAASTVAAAAQAVASSPQQQIRMLVSTTYEQPGHKVATAPIVVANDYAIADWIQGDKGGRALLRRAKGQWQIMLCAGDGLKDVRTLSEAGISTQTATNLLKQLNKAEQSVSAGRLKRFGLFGTPNDPRLADHHAHPQPQH